MEIVEQLQEEVAQRAGSREGFMEVIRLVLDNIEKGEENLPYYSLPYLETFRTYVGMMQEVIQARRQAQGIQDRYHGHWWQKTKDDRDAFAASQKKLSGLIHAARKKRAELPAPALKRVIAFETRYHTKGGRDCLYLPSEWHPLAKHVESYISNWGEGRRGNHPATTD